MFVFVVLGFAVTYMMPRVFDRTYDFIHEGREEFLMSVESDNSLLYQQVLPQVLGQRGRFA